MNDFMSFVIQHWELWLAGAMVLVLLAVVEVREHMRGIVHVTTQETVRLMNREHAQLIDLRDEATYREGHILGARSVPLAKLPTQLSSLEKYKEKPLILVCQAGNQSMHALRTLRRHGFQKVYSLKGGFGAWRLANLPIAK